MEYKREGAVGKPYKTPPVAEAIAEFRFPPGAEPDLAVPGLVYERLKASFPKVRAAVGIESSIHANQGVVQQRLAQTPRLQLLRPDERVVVQISPNWLAVNHLPPYSSWDAYLHVIEQAFDAYVSAASVTAVLGLSLQYVNHFPLGRLDDISLEDFFTVYPRFESGAISSGFRLGFQLPREAGKSLLQVEMAPAEGPHGPGIHLDLLYFHGGASTVGIGDVQSWMTGAHDSIEEFFEAAIKQSLRDRFGGKEG